VVHLAQGAVNKWQAWITLAPSSSNVSFAFLTQASGSNINLGLHLRLASLAMGHLITHEPRGVRTSNNENLHWKLALVGEKTPKKFVKNIRICHPLHSIPLWTSWIEHNDKMSNGTNLKWLERVINYVKISIFWLKRFSKLPTKHGTLKMFFVGETI
jgi:hypothetical protein